MQKHLIIDGYNIIHAWPELKKSLKTGWSTSCDLLVHAMRIIHDTQNIRLTIVFDGKGKDITIERPTPELTFSLLFSPSGMSADSLIEHIAHNSKKPEYITVATQDLAVIQAVRSIGGFAITPKELKEWVDRCQDSQNTFLKQIKKQNPFNNKLWKDLK